MRLVSSSEGVPKDLVGHEAGGDPDLIAVYQGLVARWQSNNSILWQLFAFVIGADVALIVGYAGVKNGSYLQFILGCLGLGGIGLLGPLAVRFIETILLMDRLLMDRYEEVLLRNHPNLRLFHGQRMRVRMRSLRSEMDEFQKETLAQRRLTVLGGLGERCDWVLDRLGQPSLIWTGAVAVSGIVGFTLGFRAWRPLQDLTLWISAPIIFLFDLSLALTAMVSILGSIPRIKRKAKPIMDAYWRKFDSHDQRPVD